MVTTYDWWSDIGLILTMKSKGAYGPMAFSIAILSVHALISGSYISYDSKITSNLLLNNQVMRPYSAPKLTRCQIIILQIYYEYHDIDVA